MPSIDPKHPPLWTAAAALVVLPIALQLIGLTLDAEISHGLADGNPADASVAAGQGRSDGARVIHRTADVGTRIDAADDQVGHWSERPHSGEHHTEGRRPGHRPRLIESLQSAAFAFRSHLPDGTDRGPSSAVLAVGSHDGDLAEGLHCGREHVEADGIDAVVVGEKNAHDVRRYRSSLSGA